MPSNPKLQGTWTAHSGSSGVDIAKYPDWCEITGPGGLSISGNFGIEVARVIAAAPDLLQALSALLGRYTALANSGYFGSRDPETEDEVIAARAALAKAVQ